MILSAQSIRGRSGMIDPFVERALFGTLSYGLSPAGYDIRIAETLTLYGHGFALASSIEQFDMPYDVLARVADKSTWARRGLCVQNTIIEPGWRGYLTLELTNHTEQPIELSVGMPIAQVIFELLDEPTAQPYPEDGKYQDQQQGPVGWR